MSPGRGVLFTTVSYSVRTTLRAPQDGEAGLPHCTYLLFDLLVLDDLVDQSGQLDVLRGDLIEGLRVLSHLLTQLRPGTAGVVEDVYAGLVCTGRQGSFRGEE